MRKLWRMTRDIDGPWVAASERAEAALVHVASDCRRGASGAVLAEGVVVTTARAVAGCSQVHVLQGETSLTGTVTGVDVATDLAVVRTEAPIGQPLELAARELRLGGSVLLALRPGRSVRVRAGLVAQLGEAWHTPRGGQIERYVELDVAVEPGFSGGVAFGADGQALGLGSAVLLRGRPLLLPKATLERVTGALLAHGRLPRGYLGVGTQAVRLPAAVAAGQQQASGLLVSSVQEGSPAERAGLLLGDVLLALGSSQLLTTSALAVALQDREGQPQTLSLLRAGALLTLEITPGARP